MLKFCRNCDLRYGAGAQRCARCGGPLTVPATPARAIPVATRVRRRPPPPVDVASLPHPLSDPLRGLRKALFWLNLVTVPLWIAAGVWQLVHGGFYSGIGTLLGGVIGIFWIRGVARLLPDRPADILYLRSFRTDPGTGGIRTALERALDAEHRVSGIRDPKRRWPRLIRFASYILFALKYANPKYLNLEAGDEWKARLWRSLGESRGVVIDLADLTEAVEAEIRLCAACLGPRRILFVVRGTGDVESWRNHIRNILGEGAAERGVQIAVWHDRGPGRAAFEERVTAFGDNLPREPAGFREEARRHAVHLPDQAFEETNNGLGREIAGGMILGVVGMSILNVLGTLHFGMKMVIQGLVGAWFVLLCLQYVSFRRNCGSRRRRRIAAWVCWPVFFSVPFAGLVEWVFVPRVRTAASMMTSSNNLKQVWIGLAVHESERGRVPARATCDIFGRPLLSWRVALLPHIEQEELYKRFRLDEPWDSPHNRELIPLMPECYRTFMTKDRDPPGTTRIKLVAGPAKACQSATFSSLGMTRGMANTVLAVEGGDPVFWTQPDDLPYEHGTRSPRLEPVYSRGMLALMGDGRIVTLRRERIEPVLRSALDPNDTSFVPLEE